jgi:hypothetical protein
MYFLNESEIDRYATYYRPGTHRAQAALLLQQFKDAVNSCSDGWPYWSRAPKAAAKLMAIVDNRAEATDAAIRRALTPIKSLCTRHKVPFTPGVNNGSTAE